MRAKRKKQAYSDLHLITMYSAELRVGDTITEHKAEDRWWMLVWYWMMFSSPVPRRRVLEIVRIIGRYTVEVRELEN